MCESDIPASHLENAPCCAIIPRTETPKCSPRTKAACIGWMSICGQHKHAQSHFLSWLYNSGAYADVKCPCMSVWSRLNPLAALAHEREQRSELFAARLSNIRARSTQKQKCDTNIRVLYGSSSPELPSGDKRQARWLASSEHTHSMWWTGALWSPDPDCYTNNAF